MTKRTVVLLGIGHTNAHVVREWAINSIPNCRLVCISKFPFATYSGMLPGTLAGQFNPDEMQIDLASLVHRAGAELIIGEVTGLDAETQTLMFSDHEPLQFDVLSVGVGSMPAEWHSFDSPSMLPIKPMQTFLQRLDESINSTSCERLLRFAIVGGGVAGVEIALCLRVRIDEKFSNRAVSIQIITRGDSIGGGLRDGSVKRLRQILADRGIEVMTNQQVTDVTGDTVITRDGRPHLADRVIWATGAVAPPVLRSLGLPTDERGFLATDRTMQTTAGLPIFAVGDCGTNVEDPAPKAGVYAVRQAPVLWHNLQAALAGRPLQQYRPQRDFLKILNTGNGKALLEYKGISLHAGWCMSLKNWIDRRFIARYQIESLQSRSSERAPARDAA